MDQAEELEVRRWTAKRRVTLVLEIVRGDTTPAEAARKHGLTVAEIEDTTFAVPGDRSLARPLPFGGGERAQEQADG